MTPPSTALSAAHWAVLAQLTCTKPLYMLTKPLSMLLTIHGPLGSTLGRWLAQLTCTKPLYVLTKPLSMLLTIYGPLGSTLGRWLAVLTCTKLKASMSLN